MNKEKLFELIRREEVVLFAGAGMSIYAGFPSGPALAKSLYNDLTNEEKENIEFTTDLAVLANHIYNFQHGKKNYLLRKLKDSFLRKPKCNDTHLMLSKIPHFKTIITTNYDSLFEDTNDNIEVIRRSKDYPIADLKKQLLFKIHGDLTDTDNIILTDSDYDKYFSTNQENTLFWNAIKDRLASNAILFIGYSLEDSNINVLIRKIIDQLGENRKEMFFVSPEIKEHKKRFLERYGIFYFETTGEKLIEEIFDDLKLNYFPNLSKGLGTADIALKFAKSNDMNLDITKVDEGYTVANTDFDEDYSMSELKFTFNIPKERSEEIFNSFDGKNFNDIVFDKDNINTFDQFFKGFRLREFDDIKELRLIKLPYFEGNVDIRFEDDFEVNNIYLKMFIASPNVGEKQFKINILDFTIVYILKYDHKINTLHGNISIEPNETISNVSNGLRFFDIFNRSISGSNFKIFQGNNLIYEQKDGGKIKIFEEEPAPLEIYLKGLKEIEKHYNIRFSAIELNDIDDSKLENILAFINKRKIETEFNQMKGNFTEGKNDVEVEEFLSKLKEDIAIVRNSSKELIINFHGIDFNLGICTLLILDGYIANFTEVKERKTKAAIIKSKSNKQYFQFGEAINLSESIK
ncbi:SIR2-like protein [Chryseobacterium sp. AG844]|nr:SIR2-like protein [Chryseobacterium sp. AG844]